MTIDNDNWSFPAAYTREEVDAMIRRGEISEARGEELLTYRIGIDVGEGDRGVARHLLTTRDGSREFCGGPGRCKWCDGGLR